jgi:hypothetical protein
VAIAPTELDGIVSNGPDLLQCRAGNRNKSSLRPVSLAKRAWAITAEIFLRIFPHMAVVPLHPYGASGLNMVDFSEIMEFRH